MRVAVVVEWADPWRGGAETSTLQFVRHLTDQGIQVELFTRSRLSPVPGMGVQTIRVRNPSRGRCSARFAAIAARKVSGTYDLVHAITPCLAADIYEPRGGLVVEALERNVAIRSRPAAKAFKRLTARLNYRQRVMLRMQQRLLTRRPPPMVIAISGYVARQLKHHYHFPESHIRQILNGVDPDQTDAAQRCADRDSIRALYQIPPGDLLTLTVAHNFKLKGVGCWIASLCLLRDSPQAHGARIQSLVVGGDHPLRWQRMAARYGVADRIRFTGPTQRIAAFYHAADVLVHPTFYDPCSRVVLEAMMSGLPVVTTRFDGSADVVEDGVSGFVLQTPTDVAGLADRVRRLSDPALRARLAMRAQLLESRISMRRHAEQVVKLYRSLVPARS
ncbi:MAG TPA: glycosyltransferase family 4 protein [Phycisphaerae bacterium]|jgi:UDP-glucose:(heptosyl)LPS alpha-1,3-glucosyltransferase